MHFHLPKPLHGWREFVGEVGIIVIGVLLALGAENLVERWHWREQADISKDAFKGELGAAAGVAYERLVVQPCLQGRIRELSQLLADGTGAWKASPMAGTDKQYLNVMPIVYRAPSRLLPMDGWKNALSNETLNHLPAEQVRDLSALYYQIGDYDTLQKDEDKAAARLVPLAFNRVLDDRSRADLQASPCRSRPYQQPDGARSQPDHGSRARAPPEIPCI